MQPPGQTSSVRALLRLAGTPCVALGTGDGALRPLARRDAAMLAWLALEGPTPRGRLGLLLWPDSDAESARNALRQRLFQLRRSVGLDLVEGSATLALAAGVSHDLDDADSVLGETPGEDLAAGEFARWLDAQRTRRRARVHRSLVRRAETAEQALEWDDALSHARELLALEPLSEEAHRRVIRLHYLAGDRAAALLAFDHCERVLKDEVGAAPSAATLALLSTVQGVDRHKVRHATPPGSAVVPVSVLRPPHLVGRETEQHALAQAWQQRRIAIVLGDGGMGKTRLMGEFAAGLGAVLRAGSRPGDERVPYASASRLLRQLPSTAIEVLPAALREALACLLPEFGASQPLRTDADRSRFFNAIASVVDSPELGFEGCIIDDLHFADEASVELFAYLVGATRCRWAFATREADVSEASRKWLDAIAAEGHCALIRLRPLTIEQVAELIDSLQVGALSGAAHAEALRRQTGGNPLYLLEAVKSWLSGDGSDPGTTLPAVDGRAAALVAHRIQQLSVAAVRLARCAAIATPDFSIELAAQVLGVRTLDLADPWAELEAANVLCDGAFAHDLIYESALASVPAPVARQLHAEIAAYLDSHGGEPIRLAGHWAQAHLWTPAGDAYVEAARRALDAGRDIEHCHCLAQAAQCYDRAGDADARFDALLARANVMADRNLGAGAQAAVVELQSLARSEAQQLSALAARVELARMRSLNDELYRYAPAGMQAACAQGRPDLEARFAMAWSDALLSDRRLGEALAVLARCEAWVEARAAPETQWDFYMSRALTLDHCGRLRDAAQQLERCQTLARDMRRPDLLWQAIAHRAGVLSRMGRVRESVEFLRQATQLARTSGEADQLRLVQTEMSLAHRLRDLGHYAEALALFEQQLEAFAANAMPVDLAITQHRLALLFIVLGQPARARPLLDGDGTDLPKGIHAFRKVMQGELAFHLGGDAVRKVREGLADLDDREDVYYRTSSLFAARIVPAEEGEDLAASMAAWALRQERLGLALGAYARAAQRAADQGAWSRALVHLEAALALESDVQPENFYLGELWWTAGRVYQGLARSDAARQVLARGRDWIRATAAEHVPPPYRDSFLHRNPVNRELLALASRLNLAG